MTKRRRDLVPLTPTEAVRRMKADGGKDLLIAKSDFVPWLLSQPRADGTSPTPAEDGRFLGKMADNWRPKLALPEMVVFYLADRFRAAIKARGGDVDAELAAAIAEATAAAMAAFDEERQDRLSRSMIPKGTRQ